MAVSEEKEKEEAGGRNHVTKQGSSATRSEDISNELVVKEVEVGSVRSRSDSKKGPTSVSGNDNASVDLYPWAFSSEASADPVSSKDSSSLSASFSALSLSGKSRHQSGTSASDKCDSFVQNSMDTFGEHVISRSGSNKSKVEVKVGSSQTNDSNAGVACYANDLPDNPWSKNEESWRECSVKTVFPFSKGDASCSRDISLRTGDSKKDKRKIVESDDTTGAFIEVEEMNRPFPFGKPHESEEPPAHIHWEEKAYHHGTEIKLTNADSTFLIGSFLDVPIGQEINSSGGKRTLGSSWLSVSQGIAEDADLVSGFATVGDETVEYPNDYWDSDEYDDDDDVGYTRQPIEDETCDNEKGTGQGSIPDQQARVQTKDEDDDQSFAEEDSYFSGEQYFQAKNIDHAASSEDPVGLSAGETFGRTRENDLIAHYDGQLMDAEELNLMRAEPVWKGLVTQSNELVLLENDRVLNENEHPQPGVFCIDDDHHGSVRSIGVGISSDAADIGSEVRESLIGGSSEGDIEYFHGHDHTVGGPGQSEHYANENYFDKAKRDKKELAEMIQISTSYGDGGFSFTPPIRADEALHMEPRKSSWSSKDTGVGCDDGDEYCNGFVTNDDMLATWRQKGNDSSLLNISGGEHLANTGGSRTSTGSTASHNDYAEKDDMEREQDDQTSDAREEDPGATLEDEEAAAVQEQIRQIKAQEEEFETFNLKIVHRKNRTGFEEEKNFQVVLNSVIAGRYHVTEFLGSAAFSKAIQAHDLHTGMDVCPRRIKLLKFVNKHDPADKYHILRLYDYFYYREHLLIVCELLKANLYEFHKFNRESGGEVYFTMSRLQSITIQCLEALEFLHGLGLIHCDLKPENILIKSYSRCEVKVIDLGSSCFETDHLCSYVQSRSYRAPEVILGLPYDKKIDIWSLGCILAELCTGNVLFQNDSPATLLARVVGIIGPIDQTMLAKGRDTYKYFTKGHLLYERNQETNRLECLIPKKTSLRHRLPMGDQGFIDFVSHLLEINPKKRPSAAEALKHHWITHPYEPISS
ncbi:unnamed protein product [Spirodela intermedia]|uniref:Protein kinase domain-containing protein n=1 Tax=Spirodela intermedia TaxID=51605 RepID=A0A7I8IN28_SPIIN|nr:unnamed protein product [Spirodela intermedia]CAA6659365.1 unnamed protein product [Spirodela intermedia]